MKKIQIDNITIDPPIILAPLAGITSLGYRKLMKRFSVGLVVSEMISDFALIYNNKETFKMLETCAEERPLAIQLFGGSKESILKAVKILNEKANFDILDINLGCPVPKVVKDGAGSSWIKQERQEELYEMMKAVVETSIHPVTAKIRIGWNNKSINVIDTCKILEKSGVKMIAIHGRTREDFYQGNSDYMWIKRAKEAVSIPIIANGDIVTPEGAIDVLTYTKADGVMIGRGCLGNPELLQNIDKKLKGETYSDEVDINKQIEYCKEHYLNLIEVKGKYRATQEMRGLAPHYFKGYVNAKKYRAELAKIESYQDFIKIIENIKTQQ